MCFPFETLQGPQEYYTKAFEPLFNAIPDLEKRTYILMANEANGDEWLVRAVTTQGPLNSLGLIFHPPANKSLCVFMSSTE